MAVLGLGSFLLQKLLCHAQASPAAEPLGNVECLQRGSNPQITMIVRCLLKLGGAPFSSPPHIPARKVPGAAAHAPPCTALSYGHTQGEHRRNTQGYQPGGPQSGTEPEHRDGVRHSGTYRHAMAKGKRQWPQGAPRGEAQRCISPAALWHVSAAPGPPGLQFRALC